MTIFSYTYNITDTLNNLISPDSLKSEIETNSEITKALDNPFPISVGETTFVVKFKEELLLAEKDILDTIISQHMGISTNTIQEVKFSADVPKTSDGKLKIASEKSNGDKVTINSHDWCDKTTWFGEAIRVVEEIPTTSDNIVYTLSHNYIIDIYHGKLINEERLKDAQNNSYRVIVTVNDSNKIEKDPHYDISPEDPPGYTWDYTINYVTGSITFVDALDPEDIVKVTYHYATGSIFFVRPPPGKNLEIGYVECQFTADIGIKDTILFEPYGLVDVFAPHLIGQGLNSGDKVYLGDRVVYKTMRDYLADSVKSYPPYSSLSAQMGWRGLDSSVQVFSWDYVRATTLVGAAGMEIRIRLEKNVQFDGSYASVTFYCGVE